MSGIGMSTVAAAAGALWAGAGAAWAKTEIELPITAVMARPTTNTVSLFLKIASMKSKSGLGSSANTLHKRGTIRHEPRDAGRESPLEDLNHEGHEGTQRKATPESPS